MTTIQRAIGIPEPTNDVDSLWRTTQALKEAVEIAQGIRGNRGAALSTELASIQNDLQVQIDAIEAAGGGATNLNELTDVINAFVSLTDGDVLTYDTTNGWQNEVPSATPPPTHTGEVTGDTNLTLDVTAITNRTDVVADAADDVTIHDDSDGLIKKVNLSSVTDGGYF